MRVVFKRAWQFYRVGDVIDPPGTLRQWLMATGFVEPVAAESSDQTTEVSSNAERTPKLKSVHRKSARRAHE